MTIARVTTESDVSAGTQAPTAHPGKHERADLPANVASKQESVATKIRDLIIDGALPSGLHLMEVPLAERLGVSRTPVRDALTLLAQEGLLEPGPKRGFKVRTFTLDEILEAYDVRGVLEGAACRMLAEKGVTDDVASQLLACLETGDRLLEVGEFNAEHQSPWLEMNNTLHTLLTATTGNQMLCNFISQSQRVPLAGARHVHWYKLGDENYDLARRAHRDHHAIIDAILKRQSHRAQARMEEHIHFSRELVEKRFQQQRDAIGFDTAQGSQARA